MSGMRFTVTDHTRSGAIRQARAIITTYIGHGDFTDDDIELYAEGIAVWSLSDPSSIVGWFNVEVNFQEGPRR